MDKLGPLDYKKYPVKFETPTEVLKESPFEVDDKAVYEGEWKDGLRHGKGI